MNTPAHMALGLAVLGRRPRRGDWWWILAGALLPDVFLYALHFARSGAQGIDLAILANVFNSLPLYLVALGLGLALGQRWLWLVAAAAILHIAFDLPLHNRDAHQHFFPFTDWVFVSPISFWDAAHHGRLFGTLEGLLFAGCMLVIWRRLDSLWQRLLAAAFALAYLAAFVHFVGHAWAGQHWAIW